MHFTRPTVCARCYACLLIVLCLIGCDNKHHHPTESTGSVMLQAEMTTDEIAEVSAPIDGPFLADIDHLAEYHVKTSRLITYRSSMHYYDFQNNVDGPEFDISLKVLEQNDSHIVLEGKFSYIYELEEFPFGTVAIDTRLDDPKFIQKRDFGLELTLSGPLGPQNSFSKALAGLKGLTSSQFLVELTPSGAFKRIENYPQPALIQENLGYLSPESMSMLLCVMFPSRDPLIGGNSDWVGRCPALSKLVGGPEEPIFQVKQSPGHPLTYNGEVSFEQEQNHNRGFKFAGEFDVWFMKGWIEMIEHTQDTLNNRVATVTTNSTIVNRAEITRKHLSQPSPRGL